MESLEPSECALATSELSSLALRLGKMLLYAGFKAAKLITCTNKKLWRNIPRNTISIHIGSFLCLNVD